MLTRVGEIPMGTRPQAIAEAAVATPALPLDRDRLDYLDNLRTGLTILVICHHVNSAYGSIGGWSYIVSERGGMVTEILATMFAGITQAFFMSSFFLISAYFIAPGYDRKGPVGYTRRRLVRLGIPIIIYYYVLSVVLAYLVRTFQGKTNAGFLDFFYTHFGFITSPGPLWFTSALLVFEGFYLAFRFIATRQRREIQSYPLPTDRQVLLFVVGIGLFTFQFRQWFPLDSSIWHFKLGYFPLYVAMFTFGVMAYRSGWFMRLPTEQANRWFHASLLAMAVMPVLLVLNAYQGHNEYVFRSGFNWQSFSYAVWEPFICVGVNMKLIVFFRDHGQIATPLTRRMARSSYAAYIFHAFFIAVATYLFTFFSLGRIPEIILMWPVAVIPCFLFADVVRRLPGLKRVL